MGRLIAATFSLLLAIALGTMAVPLALWAGMASYRPEWASGWALWALERSPLPLYAAPMRVATDVMQRDFLVAASLAATVLCLMAFSALRSTRRALRSPDESHDGKATIGLKTQALRVGRPVEGSIWLAQRPEQGDLYRVQLSCSRGRGPGKSDDSETAYWEELEVAPIPTPVGWSLPFRFAVPPIAPPSGVGRFVSGPGYHWCLAVKKTGGWMSFPSVFALHLAPAPAEELRVLDRTEAGRKEPELKRALDGAARDVATPPLGERVGSREPAAASLGSLGMRPGSDAEDRRPRSPARSDPREGTGARRGADEGPLGDLTAGDAHGSAFAATRLDRLHGRVPEDGRVEGRNGGPAGDVTPGDAHGPAHDAPWPAQQSHPQSGHLLRASPAPAPRSGDPASAPRRAPGPDHGIEDMARKLRMDPPLHERPEFRDDLTARGNPGVIVKIVKWLFLVLFGGALAVSAVALVTAVLLGYIL